jgi:hypothetical protein
MVDVTSRDPAESRTARVRRLVASSHAGATALVLAAAIESIAATAALGRQAPYVLGCLLFALGATVPVAFLDPPAAAVTVTGANLLSLGLLGRLTVAGSLVQLIALYRLTRLGPRRTAREVVATILAGCFVLAALTGGRPLTFGGERPRPAPGGFGSGRGVGRDRPPSPRRSGSAERGACRHGGRVARAHRQKRACPHRP